MPRYMCEPETLLNGITASSLLHSLLHEDFAHIVHKVGLDAIEPDGWYPVQKVLDVFNEVADLPGATMDFVSVGIAAAELSPLPPEIAALSPVEFFSVYEKIYPQRHRNGNPGTVKVQVRDANTITLTHTTPYPDDVMYGLFYGYARRFAKGKPFIVQYDENVPRLEQGGKHTIIHITYEDN